MANKTIEEYLEGKSIPEIIRWFKSKLKHEVGKAFYMGKVEALLDLDYTPGQIAEMLGKSESATRAYVKRIENRRNKK